VAGVQLHDADGDGYGDTWYAGGNPPVVLTRPYRDRGVPPRYRRYDLPFLKWLAWTGKTPDMLCDDDLESFADGDELRARYDLVVFPGHTEYVTEHAYIVVERFRDLGGRLIFLSANNFFWKVQANGDSLRRIRLWRNLGRPEAALIGAQYRANDNGTHQGVFYVTSAQTAPWLWEGTGLTDGSTVGDVVGGYGIEIDATTRQSPPGTLVLALIPNLFGPGVNAEMTYYETPAGARVFDAGALDFSGSATTWPVRRMLENLWAHMLS
jgi:N,N-dimethylformamidase